MTYYESTQTVSLSLILILILNSAKYLRNRSLGKIEYLQLDAWYEKIRQDGVVLSCAVLIATGVMEDGKRSVLGTIVSLSELKVHWRQFLLELQKRGRHGIKMITSDDHYDLKAALESVFPNVPGQQTHLQRNAVQYVPRVLMRKAVASDVRSIFIAGNSQKKRKSTNMVERRSRNIKRRTFVASLFPNKNSLFGLVGSGTSTRQTKNYIF